MQDLTGILLRDYLCNKGGSNVVNDVAQMDILVGNLRHCWMDRTLLSAWHHVLHLPPQPDPHLPEALTLVAHKMLHVIFSVLKNERPYTPILT
jgi:hypothetical protein